MAPTFRITTENLPEPGIKYLPVNEDSYGFPPRPEYLASLTPLHRRIYECFRAQHLTDEQCYKYLTQIDKLTGFHREYLRHIDWPAQRIQQWEVACETTTPMPEFQDGLSKEMFDGDPIDLILYTMKEGNRRQQRAEEMEKEFKSN
ncbi:uncharacterized protein N7459_009429 [Penicillium hispanicum]|uniref:uncharacterized protein n=1 Tax=Penicillium hispanicum TaxID=1080232 RepID=UPI002540DAF7|nr:uncharacterized protein N7459_009429 [Penicillium hispanicum]KAJ5569999.1 hypothetical protein N7459_009429 [Penicillium hispanicum]